jgi:DNA-binding NarL/FixJ family response regulator
MLVDDNLNFQAVVKRFMESLADVSVIAQASNGTDALRLAELYQPDLVLLDISMPVLSGIDVAQRMQGWKQKPSIIFLSMHDNEAYRDAAREMGVLGFVTKSNFVDELVPLMETLSHSKADLF